MPDLSELERLIAPLYKKARKQRRQRAELKRQHPSASEANTVEPGINCYVCKAAFPLDAPRDYPRLCPACAGLHEARRQQSYDFTSYRVLITGGRIKIGYATALRFLRAGAEVHVTTRFPHDAALRYHQESDFDAWKDRLTLHALNLLYLPDVLRFVETFNSQVPHLDILIHNAAQSVKLPKEQLQLLVRREAEQALPANLRYLLAVSESAAVASPAEERFEHLPDVVDQREHHGWTMQLADVDAVELVEVLLINAAAPALLTSRLHPLLARSPKPDRFVINVTGYDGQFGTGWKSTRHPHVNMSKAALNMMTRTAAEEYAKDRIWMNSVDVGWITFEGPWSAKVEQEQAGIRPPLDAEDGATRICDPIIQGLSGKPLYGQLFRHFQPVAW